MQANICCLSREEEECLNFLDTTIGSLDESSLFHKNLTLGSIRSREDTVDLLTNAVQQNDGADAAAVFTSTKQLSEAEPVEHNLSDSSFQQSSEGSLTSAFENNRTTHPAQQQQRVMDTQLFGPGSMPGANAEALAVSTMIENGSQTSPDELSLQNKEEAGDSSDEQGQGSESDWPSHSPAENIHSPSDPKELHTCGAGRIPGRIGPAQTKNFNTIMKAGVNVQKRRAVMLDLLNHHNNNNNNSNNSNSNDSDSGLGLSPRDQNLFVPPFSTSVPFTEQPFAIKGDVRSFERSEFRDERDSNSVSQPQSRSGSLVEAPAKMWPISRSCSERRIKLNGKTIAKYPSFEDEMKKSVSPLQKPVSQQITIVGPGHWKIIAPKS